MDVGVRELKGSLSSYLRRAAAGERIRVTDRGRPIAEIVPAGASDPEARMRALIAAGKVTPGLPGPKPPPPRRVQLAPGAKLASQIVLENRERRS